MTIQRSFVGVSNGAWWVIVGSGSLVDSVEMSCRWCPVLVRNEEFRGAVSVVISCRVSRFGFIENGE